MDDFLDIVDEHDIFCSFLSTSNQCDMHATVWTTYLIQEQSTIKPFMISYGVIQLSLHCESLGFLC
jgi:hypothetical protein